MASVFVSYRHVEPDAGLAHQLAAALETAGHRVFLDTKIPLGTQWGDVIEAHLADADCLIAIVSAASATSPMVVTEIAEAHRLNVERGRPYILPVRLGETFRLRYPLSAYVSRFQQAVWRGPDDSVALVAQVGAALETPPARRPVASQRLALIERVRGDWIKGVLENSLYQVARLELGLQLDRSAVSRGIDVLVQRPDESPQELPRGTSIARVYDDHVGQLLILGAPGSGKTTLLLELARDLLDRAEQDSGCPVPVVFNLSSWARERRPLQDWMTAELHLRSDAPRKLAREWVDHEQILPLLDGLDEVADEHRPACVAAINAFRRDHGWLPIVVCSRTAEYSALSEVLALPAAVMVQPITRAQVEEYLDRASGSLTGVRVALRSQPALWDLLETPLGLSIVALAYRNRPDVPATTDQATLFAEYVRAMFRRRGKERRYAEADMRAWLHWLAATLVQRAQTLFLLEDVVPEWFLSPRAVLWANGLTVVITTIVSSLWCWFVLATTTWAQDASDDSFLIFGVFTAPVAVLLGLLHGRTSGPVDALHIRYPGWRTLVRNTLRGAALGAPLGGALMYAGCYAVFPEEPEAAREFAVAFAGVGAVTFGLLFAARSLVAATMLGERSEPGALVKRSARSAAVTLAASILVSWPFAGRGALGMSRGPWEWMLNVGLIGLWFVGWAGIFLAFERGGYFLVRHYLARVILWRTRRAPWRYSRFLDVAVERLLLRRVGGGYIFVHRALMEYLARDADAASLLETVPRVT